MKVIKCSLHRFRCLVGFPFAVLFGLILRTRHLLYDKKLLASHFPPRPSLCIGNLTVGGTGKTPHTEFFIDALAQQYRVAVVSRGYKRKKDQQTLLANSKHTAQDLGDEPLQMWLKYQDQLQALCVGRQRLQAIKYLLEHHPNTEIILLDDAYQHRRLQAHYNLLLCDYNRPFFEDYLLPSGWLRDLRIAARRAQAVVVSKCPPTLSPAQKKYFTSNIRRYAPQAAIFFSTYTYTTARPVWDHSPPLGQEVVLLSGIATPSVFEENVRCLGYDVRCHLRFQDHHHYRQQDLDKTLTCLAQHSASCILMTEKDYVKIKELPHWRQQLMAYACYYLPIRVQWIGENPLAHLQQYLQLK